MLEDYYLSSQMPKQHLTSYKLVQKSKRAKFETYIYPFRLLRTPTFPITSPLLKEFNVVSTQSTAKPGCVLEVGKIEDSNLVNKQE